MARKKTPQSLTTDKHEGQQSARGGLQSYFLRNVPLWNPPAWQEAAKWRLFVEKQSIASICRDTLANYLNSLDWMIVARDTEKKDELKGAIKHYTKLFERGNAYWWEMDFSSQVEWFTKDLFTLPFGTASELGRLDDNPKGRVVWIRPLDGGTLAPTLNFEFPIVQSAPSTQLNPVFLSRDFSSRAYLSPRTELQREGWGYAPPERIWRAIEMVSTGDNYYAQFLIDTPEAGVLDLMDMDKSTAEEWVRGAQDLFFGVGALKIPVLYEHEQAAKWIPFGRPPSELMYDSVTMKYASIICSGYGLTLSDIGFSSDTGGGDTLAGTIRMERVGKSSGKALAKKKWLWYANQILPDALKWTWIDYDDERNVSKGRARLASAQAANSWINDRVFLPSEIRKQTIADGLFSIDLPEDIDENSPEFKDVQNRQGVQGGGNRASNLRTPQSPSMGGHGEIIPQQILQKNKASAEVGIAKAAYSVNELFSPLTSNVLKLESDEIPLWEEYVDSYLIHKAEIDIEVSSVLDSIGQRAVVAVKSQAWVDELAKAIEDKATAVEEETQKNKALYRLEKKKEDGFISGTIEEKSDNSDALVQEIVINKGDLHSVIFDGLVNTLSKYVVLVAKNHLLQGKLEVDGTELKENNIRVSREIANEVMENLSSIIHSVYEDGLNYLESIGETNV